MILLWFLQYPSSFKEEIRHYADILGQRTTARLFNVSQKRIFDWILEAKNQPESSSQKRAAVLRSRRKNLSRLRKSLPLPFGSQSQSSTGTFQSCPKEKDELIEREIQAWIDSQAPRKVPSTEVRSKALEIFRRNGRMDIECSYGWYRRFKERACKRKDVDKSKSLISGPYEEDPEILSWLLRLYDDNQTVSYKELQSFAQTSMREIKPNFKASAGWALRFLKRNHLLLNSLDRFCKNGKELPPNLQRETDRFREEIHTLLQRFPPNSSTLIGCMDEIPVVFSTPLKKDKDRNDLQALLEGNKAPRLRKQSLRNCDATVILALLSNGDLLPPMVIVKGQQQSSLEQVYEDPSKGPVVTYFSSTTEPSMNTLEKWMELIWIRNSGEGTESVLIWDSYKVHTEIQRKFENLNLNVRFQMIPAGCSSKLQPINVKARKIFLENMEKSWHDYLQPDYDDNQLKIKLPSTNEIVDWVQQSYEETKLKKELLAQSFELFSSK